MSRRKYIISREHPDPTLVAPWSLARVACAIIGHAWPTAPGACESHVRWLHPLEKYMRYGWGVCARCGMHWTHTLNKRPARRFSDGYAPWPTDEPIPPPPQTPWSGTPASTPHADFIRKISALQVTIAEDVMTLTSGGEDR